VTSGVPQYRPGPVAQPDQGLIDRLRALEQVVSELQKRDMNRATVGQGGTFRGYYDNGQLAFTFGEDIDDDGVRKVRMNYASTGGVAFQVGPGNPNVDEPEQFKLVDQAGAKMFATDGYAGYGLAEPGLTYFMGAANPFARTSGVEDFVAESWAPFYNPVIYSTIRISNLSGITGGTVRLIAKDGAGITQVSSSNGTIIAGTSIITKAILLPANMLNAQNTRVQWLATPVGSGTLQGWPMVCGGKTKIFYDSNPGLQ
jgi:hypothetical protein